MAEGFKIADGYIDIEADVDKALTDVRKFFAEVDGELKAEEKAFKGYGKKSGEGYVKGIDDAFKSKAEATFKGLADHAIDAVEGQSRRRGGLLGALLGGRRGGAGSMLLRDLMPGPGVFRRMFAGLRSGGRSLWSGLGDLFSGGASLFSGITKGIASAFSAGIDQAQQIWQTTSKFFQQASDIGGGVLGVVKFAAIGTAIPLVLGLAGALTQLSAAALALPAGLGVAVAAIAPLIVAFHGFGEAISAGFSGDVDKFNESLKKLAPNARKVAKEIVGLRPLLSQLRNSVQEAFFGPLVGQLTKLGNAVLPTLWVGMSHVAGALGRIAAGFTSFLASKEAVGIINNLFMTTERILNTMGPSLINLFAAFFRLLNAGLPWVERFVGVLSGGLQHVADWINNAVKPGGQFTGWLQRAWDIGKKLWDVFTGLGQVVFTMLNAFGDEGSDTLGGIAEKLKEINKYLQSKDGQETLHNLGVIVHWAGNAFVWFLGTLTTAWKGLNAFFSFVRGIGPFFVALWGHIVDGAKAVGHWFADLGRTVGHGIMVAYRAVVGFGEAVWGALVTAYNAVVGAGKAVIDWFVALPGVIWNFLTALPGMIGRASQALYNAVLNGIGALGAILLVFFTQTFPGWIRDGWNWAYNYAVEGIAKTWAAIQAFPGQLWGAMVEIGNTIKNAFLDAWNWAYNYTVEGARRTWENIQAFPGRVWNALSRLGDAIGGWFSRAWTQAGNATASGYHNVMNWITSIPGAIGRAFSSAGSWLYNAGRDIIHGLVNGIADMLDWAVNAARNAAERIKRGFLSHLGIDSPSKVMRMEVGRWILPGVMKGMQDTEPRMDEYLGATADRIRDGFRPTVNVAAPSVSVGGTTLLVDLGDGIRQAVPVQLMRNATTVAAAADVGNRTRAGWLNTARPAITGAS